MKYPRVVLKPGKEKSVVVNRHPWIFSGAIDQFPVMAPGDIADVYSSSGQFLARGYFHPDNSIAGRILSFSQEDIESIIKSKIHEAHLLRKSVMRADTNCFRLINSEADGLPGLVVDKYDDVYVIQVNTCGMDKLKKLVIKNLIDIFTPRCIYEKSVSSARDMEGLDPFQGYLFGEPVEEVIVEENGVQFFVSLVEGQKTGLFLDHREMRRLIADFSKDKKVLNCFAYTGGFSLYALKGGASHVTSVDISETACKYAAKNTHLNQYPSDSHTVVAADVFDFLLEEKDWDYDIVIIDPPAFAKKRKDIESATNGYRRLNSLVLSKVKKGTIVLTSSCSYFIDKDSFQKIVFQAGSETKRDLRILQHHILSADHPLSLYHPEGDYLKSLVLYVS
ncbi:MAG: class I SAM-dependent rRNA methyltransferase [Chlamydiae bacterium]|nr:class I SAM-dependent rRNA methyltransferase [Chlamydiota bacterium]